MTQPDPRPTQVPPRLPRHLMDPNHPRPVDTRWDMSVSHVQMWVMSILITTTILHLSVGLVVAAFFVDDRLSSQVGLLVIGGLCGVMAVVAGLAIHRKRVLTWWVLLGWLPAAVGAYLMFGA
jgi:hypothetical protein